MPEQQRAGSEQPVEAPSKDFASVALGTLSLAGEASINAIATFKDALVTDKDYALLSLSGLRLAYGQRAMGKSHDLEHSAEVFKEAGLHATQPMRKSTYETPHDLEPTTNMQRKHFKRTELRQVKSDNLRINEQSRLIRVHGAEVSDSDYLDKIKAQHKRGELTRAEYKSKVRAGKYFKRHEKKALSLTGRPDEIALHDTQPNGKVYKTTTGKDLPGRFIAHRIETTRKSGEHNTVAAVEAIQRRLRKIEDRSRKRSKRKNQNSSDSE